MRTKSETTRFVGESKCAGTVERSSLSLTVGDSRLVRSPRDGNTDKDRHEL